MSKEIEYTTTATAKSKEIGVELNTIDSKRKYASKKSMHGTKLPVRTVRLKKDIVIPAGTMFSQAPRKIEMCSDYVEGLVGLTPNTCMTILQDVDMKLTENKEWWEEVVA